MNVKEVLKIACEFIGLDEIKEAMDYPLSATT